MKNSNLLLFLIIGVIYSSCKKNNSETVSELSMIQKAETYFNTDVNVSGSDRALGLRNARNISPENQTPRQRSSREPSWENAQVIQLSSGAAVIVPVYYIDPFIIRSNFSGNKYYDINNLTKLLVYQDDAQNYHSEMITYFPDSSYRGLPTEAFKGMVFIDDWSGNPIDKYKYEVNGSIKKYNWDESDSYGPSKSLSDHTSNTPISSRMIEVYYEIRGYNYSIDDPGTTYNWVESAGSKSYYFDDDGSSGSFTSGGDYSEILAAPTHEGTSPPIDPVNYPLVLGGNNIIGNIKDYNKCFTNAAGSDHSYQVKICVSQPEPGTRDPWGLTSDPVSDASGSSNPVFVGHTFMILTETTPASAVTRNVGFYPAELTSPWAPTSQGQLNNDEMHDYDISLTITLTNSQFFNLLNFVEQGNSPGLLYNLNYNNCTTFALNAMSSIGINLPKTKGKWVYGAGFNPGDLGEDIRSMPLAPYMTRSITASSHPNQGTCN